MEPATDAPPTPPLSLEQIVLIEIAAAVSLFIVAAIVVLCLQAHATDVAMVCSFLYMFVQFFLFASLYPFTLHSNYKHYEHKGQFAICLTTLFLLFLAFGGLSASFLYRSED
jgi:hypothetical protein